MTARAWLSRNKWPLLFLLAVCLALVLPPIIHQYPYPNHSDDTPRHFEVVQRVIAGQDYSDIYRYAGPAFVGAVIKVLHTDPYWSFYVFHYLALMAIIGVVFVFARKVFGSISGYAAVLLVVFATPPFLEFFYNGVIFSMTGLYLFGLLGMLAFIYWLETRRLYYAVLAQALFAIAIIWHSSTGLYIIGGMTVFIGGYYLVTLARMIRGKGSRRAILARSVPVGMFYGVFVVLALASAYFLCPDTVSATKGVAAAMTHGDTVSVWRFFSGYSSWIIAAIAAAAAVYIIKARKQLPGLVMAGLGVLVAFIVLLAVFTFTRQTGEPQRVAHDLAMLFALVAAGIAGLALQLINRKATTVAACVILLAISLPMAGWWAGDRCAVQPVDQQVIVFLSELDGATYSVSTQVSAPIYQLMVKDKRWEPAGGDYIVYRNLPMTGETSTTDRWSRVTVASTGSDYAGLQVVGEFNDGTVEIIIYKNNPLSKTYDGNMSKVEY